MTDLESAGIIESGMLAVGGGMTRQEPDGTWVAAVCVADGDLGLYGAGATEGHALAALEAKIKVLGNNCQAAYAEAESRYRVRKAEEGKARAEKLARLLGGSEDPLEGLPELKKEGN